jgi:hypothetical protein
MVKKKGTRSPPGSCTGKQKVSGLPPRGKVCIPCSGGAGPRMSESDTGNADLHGGWGVVDAALFLEGQLAVLVVEKWAFDSGE